jgi:hypothetical protein
VNIERLALLGLAGAFAQAPGFAQDDVTVFSARADSVAVTIYPDDLALITETRIVQLPGSAVTLAIQGVADTLLPQSAIVNGLGRPLAESNFDFDRLSPQSLLTHAIGQTVTLMRTNAATGRVTRTPATIVAAGKDVVLETEDGNEALHCAGLPEAIVFDAIPSDLYATPQLSMELAAGEPGERTIQVSYLAHGFQWSADYVAELDAEAETMNLTGWATVTNSSSKVFDQAELQLIAGQLNVLAGEAGGSGAEQDAAGSDELQIDARARLANESAVADALLLRDCFAAEVPVYARRRPEAEPLLETVIVTGSRIAARERFGDYHLYRLPWHTDLAARQTKQVRFLEQDGVTIERFYRLDVSDIGYPFVLGGSLELRVDDSDGSEIVEAPPGIILRIENTTRAGLGEPLPAGAVRVFEAHGAGLVFVGQSGIEDRPVGAEIELEMGRALDILVETEFRADEGRKQLVADYRAVNDKTRPIDLEIRHFISTETDLAVEASSRPYELTGDSVTWRFAVPPGAETLSYRLFAREL